jgi:hypothetical protein
MFSQLFHKATNTGKRVFGAIGNVIRQWGTTSNNVSRTLSGHGPALKSFVHEMGGHFGAPGRTAAGLVNNGLDTASHLTGRIGERLTQVANAIT